eukprot:gene10465-11562_t
MTRELQRVSIPIFTGDKRTYPNWKAAFLACIAGAPAAPEYELLQLRQYLSVPSLKLCRILVSRGLGFGLFKNLNSLQNIAAELDLKGDLKAIRVSVLKGDCKSFQSMHVKFGLESINGDVDIKKKALTVNRVTGNMKKGYIRKVSAPELLPENRWYLPHFAILKPSDSSFCRATTKNQIVFEASAKYEGISLNVMIYSGPKLQCSLFDVLLRFRRHPVAIVCDIGEMYLRFLIPEADRPYHRFLWRNHEQERDPDEYEFNRVVFRVTSSPFQAQFAIQKHAQLHSLEFPMAAKTALKSTYMEDSMDSVPEVEDGIELYNQLTGLWEKAGMRARKWLCNSFKVLAVIPVEHRGSEIDLKNGELPTVKTLGILCKAKEDSFCFHSRSPEFLAPFIIRAKVIMQDVWCTGVDWDDDLDDELKAKMRRWYGDLELSSLSVPRCLHTGKHENVPSMQLHIFNDASGKAYRAVAYARHTYIDHPVTTTNIVAVKTRVAPVVFDKMVYSTSNQYI